MGALTQEDDVHQMKQGSIWIAKRDDTLVGFITFEPVHEISNNVTFDMCRLRRASAASF